jgi:integrase
MEKSLIHKTMKEVIFMRNDIETTVDAVLNFLKGIPMSAGTVKYYRSCYRTISRFCQCNGIRGFSHRDAKSFSKFQMERHERGEIGLIYALTLRKAAVMLADCIDGKELVWERRNYNKKCFCAEYDSVLSEFEGHITPSLSRGSVRNVMITTRQFLEHLENVGILDFGKLTLDETRRFIINASPRHKGNMANLTWPIKKFISFLKNAGYTTINAERLIVGSSPKRTKALPFFTEDESDALLSAIDTSTPLGKRDFAIMKTALGTGLRGEDIFGLRLADIDWRKYEISVVQSKTGTHIALPLLPHVGNAIADYILNARPKADSPYVFLRHRKPHNWLGGGPAGAQMMKRYQESARLTHEAGDGKTFHAFRRTVAARLVRAEVPLPSIAQQLGHKGIESTKRYLPLNDDMLRVCCMDISGFATTKEGLA